MMKYFTLLILLFVLAMPAFAQDATAEVTVETMPVEIVATSAPAENSGNDTVINVGTPATDGDTTESYVTSFLIGGALLLFVFFGSFAIYFVSQLVPPGIAKELVETGMKAGFQMALNRAETTKTNLDDDIYTALAKIPGLEVTKGEDGHYVVKQRLATATPYGSHPNGTPISGYTSTDTRDVGGSKPANSGAFPPSGN